MIFGVVRLGDDPHARRDGGDARVPGDARVHAAALRRDIADDRRVDVRNDLRVGMRIAAAAGRAGGDRGVRSAAVPVAVHARVRAHRAAGERDAGGAAEIHADVGERVAAVIGENARLLRIAAYGRGAGPDRNRGERQHRHEHGGHAAAHGRGISPAAVGVEVRAIDVGAGAGRIRVEQRERDRAPVGRAVLHAGEQGSVEARLQLGAHSGGAGIVGGGSHQPHERDGDERQEGDNRTLGVLSEAAQPPPERVVRVNRHGQAPKRVKALHQCAAP